MFRSARLKLTLFYLAALLAFSLVSTSTVRLLAEYEYNQSNNVERQEFNDLMFRRFFDLDVVPPPPNQFDTVQQTEAALVKQHLDLELIWINAAALVLGGLFSYWFAGRTLKPIQEAHEAQARFAADASHELRTPLTNMKVENEVFLRQKSFTEQEARDVIKSNLEEVQRLENLSSSLLDLTRYGQTALSLVPLPVGQLFSKAASRVSKSAKAKKVTITRQLPEAHIIGDQDSLIQLVCIVLDNAIKYGPKESEVLVKGSIESEAYVVSIIDQGSGIDEDDLPFIFDRLFRGDKARSNKVSGYGLGLALAQEIAKANQMAITAQNNEGGGARFDISFNLAK